MILGRLFRRTPPALSPQRVDEIRRAVVLGVVVENLEIELTDARRQWDLATEQLEAAQAEIVRLERERADAEFAGAHARQAEKRLTGELASMTALASERGREVTAAYAEIRQLEQRLADAATECVCGGDAELHWRRKAAELETRALRDRANAVALTDRAVEMRLRLENLERQNFGSAA